MYFPHACHIASCKSGSVLTAGDVDAVHCVGFALYCIVSLLSLSHTRAHTRTPKLPYTYIMFVTPIYIYYVCMPPSQTTITVSGAPERTLNTTFDRVAYESIDTGKEKVLHSVICFRSGYGSSLYQLNKGNWCIATKKDKAWETMKCNYLTLDRDKDAYGHDPGAKLTWYGGIFTGKYWVPYWGL